MRHWRERLARLQTDESGIAMMMAMAVVLILSLITVALANITVSEYSTAAALDASNQALLAAEAGGEVAISVLRPDTDWTDNASSAVWQPLRPGQPEAFPATATPVGQYNMQVHHQPSLDPSTNVLVRVTGQVRTATRTIQFLLHRTTGTDMVTYAIQTVDITRISGGGSLQWHGSAYFEQNLSLRGGNQAGFFNDRRVFSSDAGFFNHLYICGWTGTACANGTLDVSQGNPTIGTPYYWVHVTGDPNQGFGVLGSSNRFTYSNFDRIAPPPFYPDVVGEARSALSAPGNLLATFGPDRVLVTCRWNGSGWTRVTTPDLVLTASPTPSDNDTFFLPLAAGDPTCTSYPSSISAMRGGGNFMLMWYPRGPIINPSDWNLILANPSQPIYVPGRLLVASDVRYGGTATTQGGKATIIAANQPNALTPGTLQPQSSCAFDLNSATGTCSGQPNSGHTIRARISPCLGSPGTDNPNSTFARDDPNIPGDQSDALAVVVNGSAYSNLNATSCGQEMNLVAVIGDRNAPVTGQPNQPCGNFNRASTYIQNKLQWYGVLMTREICLGQVPDFWQVPDLMTFLPPPIQDIIRSGSGAVEVRSWQELF